MMLQDDKSMLELYGHGMIPREDISMLGAVWTRDMMLQGDMSMVD
jgi:hypothetical protein